MPGSTVVSSIPFDSGRIHAAAVYCSDGRYGEQFDEFLHDHLGLPRYDRLAVPGGSACLAGHFASYREEEAVIVQLQFLVKAHGLERVVLIAHHGCAFYLMQLGIPENEVRQRQLDDLSKAAQRIVGLAPSLLVEGWLAALEGDRVVFIPVNLDRRSTQSDR